MRTSTSAAHRAYIQLALQLVEAREHGQYFGVEIENDFHFSMGLVNDVRGFNCICSFRRQKRFFLRHTQTT